MKATKVFKRNLKAYQKKMLYANLIKDTDKVFLVEAFQEVKDNNNNFKFVSLGEKTIDKTHAIYETFLHPPKDNIKGCITFESNAPKESIQRYRYIVNEGGSRSSKTWSILQLFFYIIATIARKRITIWRLEKTTCRATLLKDFENILSINNLFDLLRQNKTEGVFYNDENRSSLEFNGTDDKRKVHGLTQDIAFFNEINEMNQEVFNQIDQRTSDCIFIDWNPSEDHWVDTVKSHHRAILIHSTYRDNPFCPDEVVRKLDSYEPTLENKQAGTADTYMWEVYGLGLKAERPHQVYPKKWNEISIESFKSIPADSYYGLDFGESNATAIAEVKFYENCFYFHEVLYLPGNEIENLSQKMKDLGISGSSHIICDSAEPLSIHELSENGFNVFPAFKGAGSIMTGIRFLRQKQCYVTSSSKNLIKEKHNYSYHIDRYGKPEDKPIKKDDHILDAIRYCTSYIKILFDLDN